ncbi:hypothetical protein L1887_14443 [Cichorium endivia]|nr:hypothetical protein L1887_14443 [Cichorium endivia]
MLAYYHHTAASPPSSFYSDSGPQASRYKILSLENKKEKEHKQAKRMEIKWKRKKIPFLLFLMNKERGRAQNTLPDKRWNKISSLTHLLRNPPQTLIFWSQTPRRSQGSVLWLGGVAVSDREGGRVSVICCKLYLVVSDQDIKGDFTVKICSIVEKLSPEKYGTSIRCSGFFVRHALIVVITNASNLHGYTVRSLYKAIQTSGDQEAVVRVAVWCIGEYGNRISDSIDAIKVAIMRHTSSDLTPRAMCLMPLLKLSSCFPSCSQFLIEKGYSKVTLVLCCRHLLVVAIVFSGRRHCPSIYRTATGRRAPLYFRLCIFDPPSTPLSCAPEDAVFTTLPPLGFLHHQRRRICTAIPIRIFRLLVTAATIAFGMLSTSEEESFLVCLLGFGNSTYQDDLTRLVHRIGFR